LAQRDAIGTFPSARAKWRFKELLSNKPSVKDRRSPRKTRTLRRVAPVPAVLQFATGTLHVEELVTPNPAWRAPKGAKARPAIAHTFHVLVVPDGDWTWITVGDDVAALANGLLSVLLRPADSAGTLKARRELDALRTERSGSGVVISLSEVAALVAQGRTGSDEELRESRQLLDKVASVPAFATTPVMVSLAVPTADDPASARAVTLRARIPIDELKALLKEIPTFRPSHHRDDADDDDDGSEAEYSRVDPEAHSRAGGADHAAQDSRKGSPRAAIVDGIEVVEHGVFTTGAAKSDIGAKDTALGTVSSIGQGYPTLVREGNVVPMEPGILFGFGCLVRGGPRGKQVRAHMRVTHPPTTNPATGVPNTVDEWDWDLNIGLVSFGGWAFDKPWGMVPGKWKLEVLYGGKVMAEESFDVVAP
jgi:hypothetical protein